MYLQQQEGNMQLLPVSYAFFNDKCFLYYEV